MGCIPCKCCATKSDNNLDDNLDNGLEDNLDNNPLDNETSDIIKVISRINEYKYNKEIYHKKIEIYKDILALEFEINNKLTSIKKN